MKRLQLINTMLQSESHRSTSLCIEATFPFAFMTSKYGRLTVKESFLRKCSRTRTHSSYAPIKVLSLGTAWRPCLLSDVAVSLSQPTDGDWPLTPVAYITRPCCRPATAGASYLLPHATEKVCHAVPHEGGFAFFVIFKTKAMGKLAFIKNA